MILPQIEETELYDQIKPTPDGGATDTSAREIAVAMYACPSEPPLVSGPNLLLPAHYSGVSGTDRAMRPYNLEDVACGDLYTDGMFFPGSATSSRKIVDGTTHTIAIGEKNYNFRDWLTGATWAGTPYMVICTGASSNVVFPINADPDRFGYYVGDNAAPAGSTKIPLNHLYFGSSHSSGAQFGFADGSVRLLSETLDPPILKDMATIAGGEVNRYEE